MRKHRPLPRASAPKEPPSEQTRQKAARALTTAPKAPTANSKREDLAAAPNLERSSTRRHTSLTALARLLGRQLAHETSGKGGCDD